MNKNDIAEAMEERVPWWDGLTVRATNVLRGAGYRCKEDVMRELMAGDLVINGNRMTRYTYNINERVPKRIDGAHKKTVRCILSWLGYDPDNYLLQIELNRLSHKLCADFSRLGPVQRAHADYLIHSIDMLYESLDGGKP